MEVKIFPDLRHPEKGRAHKAFRMKSSRKPAGLAFVHQEAACHSAKSSSYL